MTAEQQDAFETGLAQENELLQTLHELGISQNRSLKLIGLSKSALHYRSKPRERVSEPIPHRQRRHPAALTAPERAQVVAVLQDSTLSVAETFYEHLDAGEFLASMSTFHRIAREDKIVMAATGPRRRGTRKTTGAVSATVLSATTPSEVVCWDISFLPGRYRGTSFALYLIRGCQMGCVNGRVRYRAG